MRKGELQVDIFAHAAYGATLFSRTGMAGRQQGAKRGSYLRDWTLWVAVGFGMIPDLASIGAYFLQMLLRGDSPAFHALPSTVFVLYHCTHSLLTASLVLGILYLLARPLLIPALAWPLHILMDSFSHGVGHWQTLMLYPLSDWHYHGINWWQHPGFILGYWGVLPFVWGALYVWRRNARELPK